MSESRGQLILTTFFSFASFFLLRFLLLPSLHSLPTTASPACSLFSCAFLSPSVLSLLSQSPEEHALPECGREQIKEVRVGGSLSVAALTNYRSWWLKITQIYSLRVKEAKG